MSHLRHKIISHKQAVCSLYKAALRSIEAWEIHREDARYECVLMRARFDANKDIKDPREAKRLYLAGLKELDTYGHPAPEKFPFCPGGSAYDRYEIVRDWALDLWHPYEKAQYPKYFATREKRKLEYIENWNRKMETMQKSDESQH